MRRNDFGEVLTAMVTPFDRSGEVNYKKLRDAFNYLIENCSDGLVVLGTTAEVPTLTYTEKEKILKVVVEEVGGEAKIVAGTGSYSTQSSIEMTKIAENIGVDGIMAVVPYYNKPPQNGLYRHFSTIAENTKLPIMIYNVPSRTSKNIEVETVQRLAEIDNIIAIKEASGDLSQVANLCSRLDEDFYVYSGDDNFTLPLLAVGGQGVISVASHVVGNEIKKMVTLFKNGELDKAQKLNKKLVEIYNAMFITTNPIPVKSALNIQGMEVGSLRSPLVDLSDDKREELKLILNKNNLI